MSALDNGLKHVIQAGIDRANQVTVNNFRSISKFSIKSRNNLIDFVAALDLNSKNLDHKFDYNPI